MGEKIMGKVTILEWTTKNPLQQIGYNAGVCWGANVDDKEKNIKRAKECISNDHGRTTEFPDVNMVLDGYSARVIREWYTHIGGMHKRRRSKETWRLFRFTWRLICFLLLCCLNGRGFCRI